MKLKFLFFSLIAACVLSSCSHAPQVSTYVLPNPPAGTGALSADATAIVVRDMQLADYINQGGLVLRIGHYQVTTTRQNRWAEPLRNGLSRYLGRAFGHAAQSPQHPGSVLKLDLTVDAFEALGFERAILSGAWVLVSGETNVVVKSSHFHYETDLTLQSYEGIVKGYAELLDRLVEDIRNEGMLLAAGVESRSNEN
jgi:uncharacterized lipoprotein YmbA